MYSTCVSTSIPFLFETKGVLNLGILTCLEDLVHSQDPTLKKEVFCFVSNVLAGTHEQIQVRNSPMIILCLYSLMCSETSVIRTPLGLQ